MPIALNKCSLEF